MGAKTVGLFGIALLGGLLAESIDAAPIYANSAESSVDGATAVKELRITDSFLIGSWSITIDFFKCSDSTTSPPPKPAAGGSCDGPAYGNEIGFRLMRRADQNSAYTDVTSIVAANSLSFFPDDAPNPGRRFVLTFGPSGTSLINGVDYAADLSQLLFRPADSTDRFSGTDAKGFWALEIEDTTAGDPLGFVSFSLNLVPSAVAPVPAPATLALLGIGLAGMGAVARKNFACCLGIQRSRRRRTNLS